MKHKLYNKLWYLTLGDMRTRSIETTKGGRTTLGKPKADHEQYERTSRWTAMNMRTGERQNNKSLKQ